MSPRRRRSRQTGPFDAESYDPEDFDDLAGRSAPDAAPTFILTFMRERETLYAQATGQRALRPLEAHPGLR